MARVAHKVDGDTYETFCKNLSIYDLLVESLTYKRTCFVGKDNELNMKVLGKASKCTYSTDDKDFLTIKIPLGVKIKKINKGEKNKDQKSEIVFDLKVVFNLICKNEVKLDDDAFRQFAEENLPGLFYPYFRELVHNSLIRAGLPPILLPFVDMKED